MNYNNSVTPLVNLKLRILFFNFDINNKSNKKNTKQVNSSENNSTKATNNINKIINKFKRMELDECYLLIKKVFNTLTLCIKKLLKHIIVENIYFYSIVSGNNAAQIGIKYGKYNMIVYNIYAVLNKIFYIKNTQIYIYPNFVNNKHKTCFNVKLKFRLIMIIIIVLAIIFKFGIIIYRKYREFK